MSKLKLMFSRDLNKTLPNNQVDMLITFLKVIKSKLNKKTVNTHILFNESHLVNSFEVYGLDGEGGKASFGGGELSKYDTNLIVYNINLKLFESRFFDIIKNLGIEVDNKYLSKGVNMKIRTDFVTNSSSSSFIIQKADLTPAQIIAIINYKQSILFVDLIRKNNSGDNCPESVEYGWHDDGWIINSDDDIISGHTGMTNFSMEKYLEDLGIIDDVISWRD